MKKFSWSITSGSITIADPLILTEQPKNKWIKRIAVVNGKWTAEVFYDDNEIQYVSVTHSSAPTFDETKETKMKLELHTNQMVFVDSLAFSSVANPSDVYNHLVKSMLRDPPVDYVKSDKKILGLVCTDQMLKGGVYWVKSKQNKDGQIYAFRIDFSPLFLH